MKENKEKQNFDLEKEIKKLKEELEKCKKEKEEYLEGWRRERADFLNYQKLQKEILEKEKKEQVNKLIKDLLRVLDSLDLAIENLKDKNQDFLKGLVLIRSQFFEVLKEYGLKELEVLGKKFDPFYCEAILEEESDKEPGTVIEVIEKGYQIGEEVLRPAKVKVAK